MLKRFLPLVLLAACSATPEAPPELVYRQIPEAWLQACDLPRKPRTNAELSDAFAKAYQCAELSNEDKRRIRDLVRVGTTE